MTQPAIRAAAEAAVRRRKFPAFRFDEPVDFRLQFHQWQMTERAAKWEKVTRTGDREVRMDETLYLPAVRRAWQVVEFVLSEEPSLRLR